MAIHNIYYLPITFFIQLQIKVYISWNKNITAQKVTGTRVQDKLGRCDTIFWHCLFHYILIPRQKLLVNFVDFIATRRFWLLYLYFRHSFQLMCWVLSNLIKFKLITSKAVENLRRNTSRGDIKKALKVFYSRRRQTVNGKLQTWRDLKLNEFCFRYIWSAIPQWEEIFLCALIPIAESTIKDLDYYAEIINVPRGFWSSLAVFGFTLSIL